MTPVLFICHIPVLIERGGGRAGLCLPGPDKLERTAVTFILNVK